MKKQIKNLILFLIIAFSSNATFSYTLTQQELKNSIQNKINIELKEMLQNYSNDYNFSITGIPNNSIEINGAKPIIEITSPNKIYNANLYRRVLIKDNNGNLIKAFPINIQSQVFSNVLVANENITFGSEINSNNSSIEKKEISKYLGKTFSSNNQNLTSKRNFPKGTIITSDYAKAKSAIEKDSMIDIVFVSKTINIKLRGKALKEGAIGENILVKSEKYNKTYNAKVISQNEVMVRI